jgi:hypothetical protein
MKIHVYSAPFGIRNGTAWLSNFPRFESCCKMKGKHFVCKGAGIATCYGLDGPGMEARWGRDFPHPSGRTLGPTQSPIPWVPRLFPGVKRPGRGVEHPLPSSAEVKERVDLYPYSSTGPSWSVLG